MKVLVVTPEQTLPDEIATCNRLLTTGLVSRLHVRKPHWPVGLIRDYLRELDAEHYDKVTLHEHISLALELQLGGIHWKSDQNPQPFAGVSSRSFHRLEDLKAQSEGLDYAFISPVFDSVSKQGYKAAIDHQQLQRLLPVVNTTTVYALGGVSMDTVSEVRRLGFKGVAVLGAFWKEKTEDRLAWIKRLKDE